MVVNTGELDVVGRFHRGVVDETVGVTSVQGWSGETQRERGAGVTARVGVVNG